MDDLVLIEAKFQSLSGRLDETTLRMWAATEARSLGRGGISAVACAIGMSRTTLFEKMPLQQAFPGDNYKMRDGAPCNQLNLFVF